MATKAKFPQQTPPVLTLHRLGTTYVLRIMDVQDSALAIHVAKGLDAEDLIVVTPTDTKTFHFGPTRPVDRSDVPVGGMLGGKDEDEEIPDTETETETEDDGEDPQERAFRLGRDAEQHEPGTRTTRRTAVKAESLEEDDAELGTDAKVVGKKGNMKIVRRPKRNTNVVGTTTKCGRCRGRGQIAVALESGQATTGNCPVCKGQGTITSYGNRR